MTNLPLNTPRDFVQLNKEERAPANPLPKMAQSISPASAEKKISFLDAWLLSSNGQG